MFDPSFRLACRPSCLAPYGAAQHSRKRYPALTLPWVIALLLAVWAAASPVSAEPIRLVALGDSLTAGLGLPAQQAFPARLQAALKARGHDVLIENAGVSGDTASAGLARIDWSVPDGTDGVIFEFGANDALRGVDPAVTGRALDAAVGQLRARGIAVLVAGMVAPPNMGGGYGARFNALYGDLARKHGVPLYPFFLDGVAGDAALNQKDGIHPTAAGVERIVERILPAVEAFLASIRAGKAG